MQNFASVNDSILAPFYIGYDSLEDFLEHANLKAPVYVSLVSLDDQGPHGVPIRYSDVRVFQIRNALAHYWLFRVQAATTVGYAPDTKGVKAAFSALESVKDILQSRGFSIVPATVAVPRDLRLMRASTGLMRFDKSQGEFRPTSSYEEKAL